MSQLVHAFDHTRRPTLTVVASLAQTCVAMSAPHATATARSPALARSMTSDPSPVVWGKSSMPIIRPATQSVRSTACCSHTHISAHGLAARGQRMDSSLRCHETRRGPQGRGVEQVSTREPTVQVRGQSDRASDFRGWPVTTPLGRVSSGWGQSSRAVGVVHRQSSGQPHASDRSRRCSNHPTFSCPDDWLQPPQSLGCRT